MGTKQPRLNIKRIKQFSEFIKTLPTEEPLNFYSWKGKGGEEIVADDMYPPLFSNRAVDFFFFAMIHNFGFWSDDGEKYAGPVMGTWKGKNDVKGSDLLWKMLCFAQLRDMDVFSPERCANISEEEFATIFSDENGPIPFFNTEKRIALTRDYGRWFRTRRTMVGQTPNELVAYANEYSDPVLVLRQILTHPENGVPGYREDPLGKKAELLIMALTNRPDHLLRKSQHSEYFPMVDYHDMRLTLRSGRVVLPKDWVAENVERRITTPEREEAIRRAVKREGIMLVTLSGKTRDEIDLLKWSARKYCPEMTEPNCASCPLQSACAKRTKLFQPVLRTTFY